VWVEEPSPFEIVLWHELIGHQVNAVGHPKQRWNYFSNKKIKDSIPEWGKSDPTVEIENEARAVLKLRLRRPQYFDNTNAALRKKQREDERKKEI